MRVIVHLSDLHFGRVDKALPAPLTATIRKIAPDLLVVSGDLTERARTEQFKQARHFLDAFTMPKIVVPGNHDISLHNIFDRFLRPLEKFRRHISPDVEPVYVDAEIAVIGVNTARSLTIKNGRINDEQMSRIRSVLEPLGEHVTKIVVTHHPFDLPAHFKEKNLVGGASAGVNVFADCGVDLLLAGHLHASHAGSTEERYRREGYSALVVQAGTAISTRGRGEPNSFNVIRIASSFIVVERWTWAQEKNDFVLSTSDAFKRVANRWLHADDRQA